MKNLSSVIFRFVVLSSTILISSSIYAQWQCPTSCSCANNTVSVTCFGATPNDGISDTTAIQSAINSVPDFWTLYFPTGRYMINSLPDPIPTDSNRVKGLEIERNNINLVGDGIGSEIYTPQNTNFRLLDIPSRDASQVCPKVAPKNIHIEKLSFSGDLNTGTTTCPITTDTGCSNLFGVFIWNGEDILISDVLIKDFGIDGLLIGNGTAIPKNITLQRIKTERIRRNAVHIGYGENITIVDSVFENSQDEIWLPAPISGNAIDLETEGLDQICEPLPITQRVPYVYNLIIQNNLIKTPTAVVSKGGVQLAFSSGPVRKVDVSNNILINSGGISSVGFTFSIDDWTWIHDVDPRLGKSARIRDVNLSSNWISNLHPSGDIATSALSIYASGDVPDSYGFNGVNVDNNVLTVYQVGGNNRPFQFSTNKEVTGNNNKTFRPYQVTTDPVSGAYNFLWRKDQPVYFLPPQTPNYDNYNVQILNTLDNGYVGSRLNCYNPSAVSPVSAWAFCNNSTLGGTGNALTWVNNSNATPTNSPDKIVNVDINGTKLVVYATDSQNSPLRSMVLQNGLPLGLKEVGGDAYELSSEAQPGDVFQVQVFNQNGQSITKTYTY